MASLAVAELAWVRCGRGGMFGVDMMSQLIDAESVAALSVCVRENSTDLRGEVQRKCNQEAPPHFDCGR
jgi:hypothetical protein